MHTRVAQKKLDVSDPRCAPPKSFDMMQKRLCQFFFQIKLFPRGAQRRYVFPIGPMLNLTWKPMEEKHACSWRPLTTTVYGADR